MQFFIFHFPIHRYRSAICLPSKIDYLLVFVDDGMKRFIVERKVKRKQLNMYILCDP